MTQYIVDIPRYCYRCHQDTKLPGFFKGGRGKGVRGRGRGRGLGEGEEEGGKGAGEEG